MAGTAVDWDHKTVIGSKNKGPHVVKDEGALNAARRSGAAIATDRKTVGNAGHSGPDHQRIAKLDRDNEVAPPAKVSSSVGKAMSTARQALGLSQKDLGQKTNEKPSVIQEYESGKATPSPQILAKFERILKVKLRGSDIGGALGAKKA